MADPVPTPTPAAQPAAQPTTPAPSKNIDEAMTRVREGQAASAKPVETPATAPTAAQGTAAAKRLLKLKIDHEEQDFDIDDAYADETKREKLRLDIQRARNADREVARTRAETQEQSRLSWNAWLKQFNQEVVSDPTHPSGWKLVSTQVTTPAANADPLTAEIETLQQKIAKDSKTPDVGADPTDILRVSELREQRSKRDAVKEWQTAQTAARDEVSKRQRVADTDKAVFTEIDKAITAHTKSFDGPDREKVIRRLRLEAREAAEEIGRKSRQGDTTVWTRALAAATAVVQTEARDRQALLAHWQSSLPTAPVKPESAPVIGTSPAVGGGTSKFKDIDEALAAVQAQQRARR